MPWVYITKENGHRDALGRANVVRSKKDGDLQFRLVCARNAEARATGDRIRLPARWRARGHEPPDLAKTARTRLGCRHARGRPNQAQVRTHRARRKHRGRGIMATAK